ncbi:hypothetical protein JTB14_031986 [Gonioctena quinquepunctata]|nr:hypothetical protein JTB14_031986 [Gonioctena quinquepunctata]
MVMGPRDGARLSESYEEVSTSDDYVASDSEKSETFEDVDGKFDVTDLCTPQVTLQKIGALKMRPLKMGQLKMQYSISLLMQWS